MSAPFWVTAFLDLPPTVHRAASDFWAAVTGWSVSPARGDHDEFTSLLPPAGDPHLRLQRTEAGSGGTHLDLHVDDPERASELAIAAGATVLSRPPQGHVVLRSPGGYTFCLVSERLSSRAVPSRWRDGTASIVDQLCLDIPRSHYDAEVHFWSQLTGWEPRPSATRAEFASLVRPPDQPLRLLLQRRDDDDGPVRGHLDLASSDRAAEVRRHVALGASVSEGQAGTHWTVMRDPAGAAYCITDRDPSTGTLP